MKYSQTELIKLVNKYLQNKTYCPVENKKEIMKVAQAHSMDALLAHILSKTPNCTDEDKQSFFRIETINTMRSCQLKYSYGEIHDAFLDSKIEHIPVKGIVIKDLYPVPELRQMGDIDIVIHREDELNVKKIMESLGYVLKKENETLLYYIKDSMAIELHYLLFPELVRSKPEAYKEFLSEGIWKRLSENRSSLTINGHLILLILHIAEHFYYHGCGIRFFLDISIYMKKYQKQIDVEYVLNEFDSLGIKEFAKNILSIANDYFLFDCNMQTNEIEDKTFHKIQSMIWENGTFGERKDNYFEKEVKEVMLFKNKRFDIKKVMGRKIVRNRVDWENEFLYLKRFPWLIPIAFLSRVIKSIKKYGVKILFLRREIQEGRERVECLKKLGL